jgi:signal transduction histidine kinase/FixJ family two-component response regulator
MKPVRVLVVEDNPDDVTLMELELRRGGLVPEMHAVETAEELHQALSLGEWDVILSDYILPRFNAPEALRLVQEMGKGIPFIVVSGSVGEEEGVEIMRAGARDYFPKNRITRLAAVVSREMAETEARRARARARLERGLLARLGDVLTEPVDFEQWMSRLAQLPVPTVADWCAIFLYEPGRGLRPAAVAHEDPEKASRVLATIKNIRIREDSLIGPASVLRTGQPELLTEVAGALREMAEGEVRQQLVRMVDLRSMLHVPLTGQRGTMGVFSLATSRPRRLGPEDLALAQELGRRISLVLENARLFRETQEAVRLRDDFLTVAAHELRTPLTTLQLQLGILAQRARKESIAPDFAERLEKCQRQIRRLGTLVEGLLDVSRLASGQMMLQPEPFDLAELVAEVVDRYAAEAQSARCQVRLEATHGLFGRWDRLRVDQAVSSLLSNAFKFGSGQPVAVRVIREGGMARVEVRDQGIGIPPDQLERIFERFERAVSSRSYGGLGLGLYLARRAAEAHGGRIWAQVPPERGATFILELPLELAEVHP